jgi:hypothetical protein
MPKELVNGVTNFYGASGRFDNDFGILKTEGSIKEAVINFTGANYTQVAFRLPAGARIVAEPLVEIHEAFLLGGTTPTINIGVSGSHGTNYFCKISKPQAESVGTYQSAAPAGTLATSASPLAAAANIVVALDGTTPTITAAGAAKVVVQYQVI